MGIKLILLCKDGESRQAYLKEAHCVGADLDIVADYGDLFQMMITNHYQGVLIDLLTSMKASKDEKGIAQGILEVFPVVQVRWDASSNSISTMSIGNSIGCDNIGEFVKNECQSFTARAIRLHTRKSINFNVTIARDEKMSEQFLERTVTINCSKGGCFFFSAQDWSQQKKAWFVINELKNKTPIVGEIRWTVEWGKAMVIPGFGISFTDIKPYQMAELTNKYQV